MIASTHGEGMLVYPVDMLKRIQVKLSQEELDSRNEARHPLFVQVGPCTNLNEDRFRIDR